MKYTDTQIKENIQAMYTKLNDGLTYEEFKEALKSALELQDQEYKKDRLQSKLCEYFSSGYRLTLLEYLVHSQIKLMKNKSNKIYAEAISGKLKI